MNARYAVRIYYSAQTQTGRISSVMPHNRSVAASWLLAQRWFLVINRKSSTLNLFINRSFCNIGFREAFINTQVLTHWMSDIFDASYRLKWVSSPKMKILP